MDTYSLTHLSDPAVLRGLASLVSQERSVTAALLAHIAEVDSRKLYLPQAYPSMYAYCVGELRLSEDAASKRIQAARAARRFPEIFSAVAQGRLSLSAVAFLAPHLSRQTAGELLAAASGRTCSQIHELLAERFPRPDVPDRVRALPAQPLLDEPTSAADVQSSAADLQSPAADVQAPWAESQPPASGFQVPEPVNCGIQQHATSHVCHIIDPSRVAPLAPGRFALQTTLSQETREKLRYAQELLSHELPTGEIAAVLDRALDALIERLERRKFARAARPRAERASVGAGRRYVPAEVKRAVWRRDRGQCTFVGSEGRRCAARRFLEFDHVQEFARGGVASVEGLRLRCRAHNQYGAECTFGAGFMQRKRERARGAQRAQSARREEPSPEARAALEVIPWLRKLGFRMDEARRAAERCAELPGATLEERVRLALSCLGR